MASTQDLSLDDIIRKKRIIPMRGRGGARRGLVRPQFKNTAVIQKTGPLTSKRGGFINRRGRPSVVGDARNNIILKNRTKIADARDKLAEIAKHKDARVKLEQLRMNRSGNKNVQRNIGSNVIVQKNRNGISLKTKGRMNRGFTDLTRQVHSSPLMLAPYPSRNIQMNPLIPISGYDMDIAMDLEEEYIPAPLKPIVRSVDNDIPRYLPPPPNFPLVARSRNLKPMRDKTVLGDRQASLNLKIVAKNNDARKSSPISHGILKRSRRPEETFYVRDVSPPSPVSILKKRPSASLRSRLETPPPRPSTLSRHAPPLPAQRAPSPNQPPGYRILVSNLQGTVTAADIHELFGDIGELLESRLVRQGTAEVIYGSLKDAQKAVDVYHNRQLDGQPMNCFLVNPRNPAASGRHGMTTSKSSTSRVPPSKPILPASSNSSVIPDVDTFYKVLFNKH